MAVLMYKIVRMRVPDCLVGVFTRHVPRERVRARETQKILSSISCAKTMALNLSRFRECVTGAPFLLRFGNYRLSADSNWQ